VKHLFFIAHTIHQTEIPALLDSWVKNIPSVSIFYPEKIAELNKKE
jgi:hypothetical protein